MIEIVIWAEFRRYDHLATAQPPAQAQAQAQQEAPQRSPAPQHRQKLRGHQRAKRQAHQQQQQRQQRPQPTAETLPQYSSNVPSQIMQILQFQSQIPYLNAIPEKFRCVELNYT